MLTVVLLYERVRACLMRSFVRIACGEKGTEEKPFVDIDSPLFYIV